MILGRVRKRIAVKLQDCPSVVVWGAGTGGRDALSLLPEGKVLYFVDSFSELQELEGKSVRRPDALLVESPDVLVVISSVAYQEILLACDEMGLSQRVATLADLIVEAMGDDSEIDRLAMDMVAAFELSWIETYLRKPQVVLNLSYRLCRWLMGRGGMVFRALLWPARFWHSFNCAFFGIDLPITVQAGGGLQLVHPGGVVVHEAVRLGCFVKIYQCVTIGSGRKGDIPTIGSHVTIWSSAILIGGCHIGDHSQVGANSLCLRNISVENGIVAGNPAARLK